MAIHTTNLGPGGTEQPAKTNVVLEEKPSLKVKQFHNENPYVIPAIILIAIPLWIIAFR